MSCLVITTDALAQYAGLTIEKEIKYALKIEPPNDKTNKMIVRPAKADAQADLSLLGAQSFCLRSVGS